MLSILTKEEKTFSLIFCLAITINYQQTLFFVYFVSQQHIVTRFNRLTLWVYILNLKEFEQAHGCIYTSKVTGPRQIFYQNGNVKTICPCFRDVAIHKIAMLSTLFSSKAL